MISQDWEVKADGSEVQGPPQLARVLLASLGSHKSPSLGKKILFNEVEEMAPELCCSHKIHGSVPSIYTRRLTTTCN